MYDPQIEFPEPLVPSELTFGVTERVRADGTILRAPDAREIEALADTLKAKGVASLAICFLNSYANADNERAVGRQLATLLPDVFLTLSSDVAPQIREYPRASTATVNAYTMPISLPYLRGLSGRLKREGFPNSPLIMLSSGGVVGAETAGRNPARMIESGPAAGALAGCHYAEVLGHPAADVVRHGRHDRQGLPDRERRAADHRPVRGRPPLALQGRQRPARHHPVDRHDRDRRGRRQHRACG